MNKWINSKNRALAFLISQQRPDGGFDSYSSPSVRPFEKLHTYQTVFVPALMLGCLASLNDPTALLIRRELERFLRDQHKPGWSFNYWARKSPERKLRPYPDDLDDTFCALASLYVHNANLISADVLAGAVKLLIAAETEPGGPYYTWLVPASSDKVWRDIDLAVNSNIAYFLTLVSEPLPRLAELMTAAIKSKTFLSPYYPGPEPIMYYLARAYHGPELPRLRQQMEARLAKTRSVLNQALLITGLLRLGTPLSELRKPVEKLLRAQTTDGSWPAAAFCVDPEWHGQRYYNGAASLTTAFVLEALESYYQASEHGQVRKQSSSQLARRYTTEILRSAQADCQSLRPVLRQQLTHLLAQVANSNNGTEITNLAMATNLGLMEPVRRGVTRFIKSLSQANLYGWLAYTIYDDFLDDEGNPRNLSAANVAHRRAFLGFHEVLPQPDFQQFVTDTFDTIDTANAWELTNCRTIIKNDQIMLQQLPIYGGRMKLAERSLGHALGPLALLAKRGYLPGSPEFTGLEQTIRQYLIARQMNDDAHDWQSDLKQGHLSYVVTKLLKDVSIKAGSYQVDELIPRLQKQFWHQTLPEICKLMYQHIATARQALESTHLFMPDNIFAKLLSDTEVSVNHTLRTQAQAELFLKHYQRS